MNDDIRLLRELLDDLEKGIVNRQQWMAKLALVKEL
jgi:hypothetical protein